MNIPLTGGFTNFSATHFVMLGLFLLGSIAVVRYGKSFSQRENRIFAVCIMCFTIPLQIMQLLPGDWDLNSSLPLQICDWTWIVAVIALWTQKRFFVATTFLLGIVLTTQAMITPDLNANFPHPRFLMFWGMHMLIVWASVHMISGLKLIPTWKDYGQTVAFTFGWLATAFVFNIVMDTNYGYVNGKPSGASILDYLGPWPLYLVLEIAIVAAVWAAIVASMRLVASRKEKASSRVR